MVKYGGFTQRHGRRGCRDLCRARHLHRACQHRDLDSPAGLSRVSRGSLRMRSGVVKNMLLARRRRLRAERRRTRGRTWRPSQCLSAFVETVGRGGGRSVCRSLMSTLVRPPSGTRRSNGSCSLSKMHDYLRTWRRDEAISSGLASVFGAIYDAISEAEHICLRVGGALALRSSDILGVRR